MSSSPPSDFYAEKVVRLRNLMSQTIKKGLWVGSAAMLCLFGSAFLGPQGLGGVSFVAGISMLIFATYCFIEASSVESLIDTLGCIQYQCRHRESI